MSTSGLPRRLPRGARITAEWINSLIDFLEARLSVAAGPGISVSVTERALVIALSRAFREYIVPAIITKANGADPDDVPDNVTYDAVGIGRPECTVSGQKPDYGRLVKDARVIKAKKDAFCFIVRLPKNDGTVKAKLWILPGTEGEMVASTACEEPPPGVRTQAGGTPEWFGELVNAVAMAIKKKSVGA